ncbi:MAG: efflux transporter outer membrane subunit [Chitinophagaceae bacterium]|nr:efflux transporter outer membrane subunit [Chitinophagaceae bacterium]
MKKSISASCIVYPALLLVLASGCRSMRSTALEQPLPVPSGFPEHSIKQESKSASWKDFYLDKDLALLVETALSHNQDIRMGLQRILIAEAQSIRARAARLPTLSAAASAAADKYGDYTMTGVGNYDTNLSQNIDEDQKVTNPALDFFLGLRSSWELDIWGKIKAQRKSAKANYLAGVEAQRWFRTQVVAQVAERYYELMALDNQLEIISQNIALQQKAVDIAEVQMAGGRTTILAIKQFQAQVLHSESIAAETRQQIRATENELNVLLGRFPQDIPRRGNILAYTPSAYFRFGDPASVLAGRADIRQAELELAASKADVTAARKAFFPSLTLNAYAGYNAFKAPLLFSPRSLASGILGGLTGPVFNQKELKTRFAIADASQQTAFFNYQKKVIQGYTEIHTQMQSIDQFREAYTSKEEEVTTLNDAMGSANELYVGGYINYLEVVTVQRNILEAQMEQVRLKHKLIDANIGLYRALGGG